MKSYTDIEQSRKLSEILPLESADMKILPFTERAYRVVPIYDIAVCGREDEIYAWSLSTLLDVLPNGTDIVKEEADTENEKYMCTVGVKDDIISTFGNNPVDACYEMILKLYKL